MFGIENGQTKKCNGCKHFKGTIFVENQYKSSVLMIPEIYNTIDFSVNCDNGETVTYQLKKKYWYCDLKKDYRNCEKN